MPPCVHRRVMTRTPDQLIAAIARRQAGCFSIDQALAAGFAPETIRSRVKRGLWVRVTRNIVCAATTKPTRERDAVAALVHAGDDVAFGYVTGARLLGFDVRHSTPDVWLAARFRSSARSRPGVQIKRTRHYVDPVLAYGYPVVPASRTVVDLAQIIDAESLASVIYDGVRRNALDLADVRAAADALPPNRAGLKLLAQVLTTFDPAFEMMVEAKVGRACASAGLRLEPQVEVHDGPFLIARLDLADLELMLGIEIDGFAAHSKRRQQRHDRRRDRQLRLLGWTIIRFDASDVLHRLDEVVAEILAVRDRLIRERARSI